MIGCFPQGLIVPTLEAGLLSLNPGSFSFQLCDLGQVMYPPRAFWFLICKRDNNSTYLIVVMRIKGKNICKVPSTLPGTWYHSSRVSPSNTVYPQKAVGKLSGRCYATMSISILLPSRQICTRRGTRQFPILVKSRLILSLFNHLSLSASPDSQGKVSTQTIPVNSNL